MQLTITGAFLCRALASSAPIWQFTGLTDCGGFYKIVTNDFAQADPQCSDNIRKSWKIIDGYGKSGNAFTYN